MKKSQILRNRAILFISAVGMALILGTFFVYSSLKAMEYTFSTVQIDKMFQKHIFTILFSSFLGFIAFFLSKRITKSRHFMNILFVFFTVLLVLALTQSPINGTKRWISILGIQIQPSEFIKLFLPLYLSWYYYKIKEKKSTFTFGIVIPLIIIFLEISLIFLEPDLSSSILIFILAILTIYVNGVKNIHFYLTIILIIITGLFIIANTNFLQDYQRSRLEQFSNKEENYQLQQSLDAITSGGLFGSGTFIGEEKYTVPYSYSDFIIAVIGEEWGKFGILMVITLYFLISRELILISNYIKNSAARNFMVVFAFWIFFQSFINIGVSVGMLPTTGVTLPLMSYGNSSLLITLISIGYIMGMIYYEIIEEKVIDKIEQKVESTDEI
ncbi:cell division protein FtsW [Marinitoga hydrogenitolerans DSM 16785]|uniref:Probable peptidoglycan glycosyltransferase FtsW n=1 Tax=Marinitoga hydrogenitolerans (strain DSM 16785 / JCM 12826 / AT1271) TaxID=1122195 RepID=A0A1M4TF59_MARH1|nr:FtsW/RodA/SpoVE family cell cycle protein [Marinitoga hydrogenitolerans]SHE43179.1 cell division protein FtsW [Marinitoga hydrogenitolerans DSM 16785]